MDFELTADQRLFRSTTRDFLEEEMLLTRVRELAERGVGYVVLGDRALGRALVDAVVDIGADGTWSQPPMKEETR